MGLFLQIQKVMVSLGEYMGVKCHACIGGTNVRDDQRKLESGVHIVVGTPGRVNDMIQRQSLRKSLFSLDIFSLFLIICELRQLFFGGVVHCSSH